MVFEASFNVAAYREVISLSKNRSKNRPNIEIPEPEMTPHKKFKCPLDQQIYETREQYDAHCKEEHDVL